MFYLSFGNIFTYGRNISRKRLLIRRGMLLKWGNKDDGERRPPLQKGHSINAPSASVIVPVPHQSTLSPHQLSQRPCLQLWVSCLWLRLVGWFHWLFYFRPSWSVKNLHGIQCLFSFKIENWKIKQRLAQQFHLPRDKTFGLCPLSICGEVAQIGVCKGYASFSSSFFLHLIIYFHFSDNFWKQIRLLNYIYISVSGSLASYS